MAVDYSKIGDADANDLIKESNMADIRKEGIVDLLNTYRVIKKGHFVLLSGLHSTNFIQFNLVAKTLELSKLLAKNFKTDLVDVVITPETSGIRLAGGIADALNADLKLAPIGEDSYPTETDGEDYTELEGKRVLIVNDIITSGKSLLSLKKIIENYNGTTVGIAAFINRGYKSLDQIRAETGINKIIIICTGNFTHYENKDECSLCLGGDKNILLSKNLNFAVTSSFIQQLKKTKVA